MKTIVLFDPSIRSLNKGDEIIMASAENELNIANILEGNYVIKCGSHTPAITFYQGTNRNPRVQLYDNAYLKFICGSNLLWKDMMKPRPVLNVNLWNCRLHKGSILMGVGIGQANSKTNLYTKMLYSKILSKSYIHSTRDQATADFLIKLGYKAIDTGCPTMWRFTPEFCRDIPARKANNVVFTLTDYGKDSKWDQQLIDILVKEYNDVYFWVQGIYDLEYLASFENTEKIQIINPTLKAYSSVLNMDDIEYVGTRLHAGMYAMQHKKRTIILAIDNRVRDLSASYELHTLERSDIDQLPEMINSEFMTNVHLKQENIDRWLAQFKKD